MKSIKRLISSILVVVMLMITVVTSIPFVSNAASATLLWPADSTTINSPYGSRPSGWHGGIDIKGSAGNNIYAAADGTIVTSKYHSSWGNYIVIHHPSLGLYTLYAHASKLLYDKGTYVSKGQVIAYIGATGNVTGPHLHFEVQVGAEDTANRANPLNYLDPNYNISNFNTHVDIGTNFTAPILNKATWKIIENRDYKVQTGDETGTSNQLWYFERQSDGSYKISSCYDGLCLDVADASSASGAKVQMVASNDTNAQRWYIYEESGGYILKAKCTDCVLDLPYADPTNGNQLQMYQKHGGEAQIWSIYRGEECVLKGPTLSVNAGTSNTNTTFTWNNVYGESCYDVKIWKNEIWVGDPYHLEWNTYSGVGINLPAGTYQAYVDAANHYECKMSNVVTFTVSEGIHTSKIDLWAWGLTNGEGDNEGGTARQLGTSYVDIKEGSHITLSANNCPASIPNGYYLRESVGSGCSGEWKQYSFGTTFLQGCIQMNFEYDCYPIEYTITYDLNGGNNSANNPSTYNVLYGVTLEDPTRDGFMFNGWVDANGNKLTGINPGANADHNSAEEFYNMLSARTIGNQILTAKWVHMCGDDNAWNDWVVTKPAACTENGEKMRTCSVCGRTTTETVPMTGHTWGDWTVTKSPTTSETGVESRYCFTCGEAETRELPMLTVPKITVDNYIVTITDAEQIKDIRYVPGVYTTTTEIRNAEGNVAISESLVKKYTVDGNFVYEMPKGGYYTVWIRMQDGTNHILPLDVTHFTPTVSTYGVKVTLRDLYDVKDFYIAKGEYETYREIKDNGYIVSITGEKIGDKHDYTYTVYEPGVHTVLIRYNDGTQALFHEILMVDEPVFTTNGLQVAISNLPDVKVIRTAYGEWNTVKELKATDTIRNFSAKTAIKGKDHYTIQYREEGIVTVIVEYNNGYQKVFHYEVAKKSPTVEQVINTVTFSDLDGLVNLRYAEGEYTTSNQIKNAKGSKVLKMADMIDGKIAIALKKGTYTFCVQYDDESYNYYLISVTEVQREIKVNFDTNGGKESFDDKVVILDNAYGELPIPARTGYTFEGWYTKKETGTRIKSTTIVESLVNHTLYAHWKAMDYTYKIVYQSINGTYLGKNSVTYNYGTTNTIYAPECSGYDTPDPQSVVWDSIDTKTIMFTYRPSDVSTLQSVTGNSWRDLDYLSYNVEAEYRNRTANSVEVRIIWTNTLKPYCFFNYNQYFNAGVRGGYNEGWSGDMSIALRFASPTSYERTATRSTEWMTINIGTEQTTLDLYGQYWDISSNIRDWSGKVTIPAY